MKHTPRIHLALLAALAPLALLADPIDWSAYKKSFDITFPGYSGSTTLTDFPVLVRLSAARNAFQYDKCKVSNGGDLRFSDAEGNLLSSEVDTWNEDGESLVWVKVPSLNASTVITAYYGCATPVAMTPSDVWSNGYLGVWHLNEASSPLADSTGGGKNFTRSSSHVNMVSLGGAGVVGNAPEFAMLENQDGTHDGYLKLSDSNGKFAGKTTMTYEMWLFPREATSSRRLLYKKLGNDTALDFTLTTDNAGRQRLGFAFQTTNTLDDTSSRVQKTVYNRYQEEGIKAWRHCALVYDSVVAERLLAYVNGENSGSSDDSVALNPGYSVIPNSGDLYLGNLSSKWAFPGQIDEVRISDVARSADWVKATYDTVNDDEFATYRTPNDWKRYARTFSVSFPGATNGVLSAFPVLVKVSESSIPGFRYADCLKETGEDLRFADENGNLLDCEVDTWDTNGVSLVWVNVPSLTTGTTIKAYYGWDFAPSVESLNVWTNGFVGVWHLGQSSLPVEDSTANPADFTSEKPGVAYGQTGIVGSALRFFVGENNTNSYVKTTAAAADKLDGFAAVTFEAWTCQTRHKVSPEKDAYILAKDNGSANWSYRIFEDNKDGSESRRFLQANYDNGVGSKNATSDFGLVDFSDSVDIWNYQVFAYDSTSAAAKKASYYLNAVLKNTTDVGSAPLVHSSSQLYLGNAHNYNKWQSAFPGKIDEVRISNVARSAEWLRTTYDMIQGNADFATYSAATENVAGTVVIFL